MYLSNTETDREFFQISIEHNQPIASAVLAQPSPGAILETFYPALKRLWEQQAEPGTPEFEEWYAWVPAFQKLCAQSRAFADEAAKFLSQRELLADNAEMRRIISHMNCKMEQHAASMFCELLNGMDDEQRHAFIADLSRAGSESHDAAINYERIADLEQEIQTAEIGPDSVVAVIGCGAISLSGLAYAQAGARVILVDRDPAALECFNPVYAALPKDLAARISTVLADGKEVDYRSLGLTHILVAGLVDFKQTILNSIYDNLQGSDQDPLLLVRVPPPGLLKLFYYDITPECKTKFRVVDRVDLGFEAFTTTLIMRKR